MRSGGGWDALAVVALALPLAGLAAPLTGRRRRVAVVPAGRRGALLGAVAWVAIVAAGAAPGVGHFAPTPATAAAAAGTLLVAAGLAQRGTDADPTGPPPVAAALGPVVAAPVVLALGLVDGPVAPSGGAATAWVLGGSVVAALVSALASADRGRGGPVALLALGAPGALLVAVRASPSLPADPSEVAGLAAALVAAALGTALAWWPALARFQASAAAVLVAAIGLSPVGAARPAIGLVAAGAALVAVRTGPWSALALAPGLGLAATASADLPTAGVGGPVHVVWAALALIGAVGVLAATRRWRSDPAPSPGTPPPLEAVAVVGGLTAWLVLAPGAWRWAAPDSTLLQPWNRAAAVAAAAAGAAMVLRVAMGRRPVRPGAPRPDGIPAGPAR